MGIQGVKKPHQGRHDMRVEDHQDGKKVWVLAAGLTLPLRRPLKPIKTGRRRQGGHAAAANEEKRGEEEEDVEEAVTPKGEGCRMPAEAETCPPAPKKPRTAVTIRDSRRCNCDGEALEFFRVPMDLEAVFASIAAKAN